MIWKIVHYNPDGKQRGRKRMGDTEEGFYMSMGQTMILARRHGITYKVFVTEAPWVDKTKEFV